MNWNLIELTLAQSHVDYRNPLLWALLVGWIMTVVLHEFAHGVAALWGGDYTIRERGGLTLNPLQYVDPIMSLLLPAIFLMMGGVPLPGGATYIRRDLLRSRFWQSAVSLAGPLMNAIIFLILCGLLQPRLGWVSYQKPITEWSQTQLFVGGLAWAQALSVILNLVPIPPLDGYGAIREFLPRETRLFLAQPGVRMFLFAGFFLLIWQIPAVGQALADLTAGCFTAMGIPRRYIANAFYLCLWGS